MVLGNRIEWFWISSTRLSLSLAAYSEAFLYPQPIPCFLPRNPPTRGRSLGSSGFAHRYSRNHICFLFLTLIRCFSLGGCLLVFTQETLMSGLPHSETAGSQVACHLPDAIVDGNVLLRLKQPRHSLSALIKVALIYLTFLLLTGNSIHFSKNGGLREIRTPDLLVANEALFQLSYEPISIKKAGGASFT